MTGSRFFAKEAERRRRAAEKEARIINAPATLEETREVFERIADAMGKASTRSCLAALTGALRNLAKTLYPDPVERNAKIISTYLLDHDEVTALRVVRRARDLANASREKRIGL